MNAEYTSIPQFFECAEKIIGKIATYDALINAFEKSILEATVSGHLLQYEMDDGQMKVRVQYRNVKDMVTAMEGLIRLRQYHINKANGRSIRLVGGNL
jgi:hypothetical protein